MWRRFRRPESELDRELRFHIDQQVADYVAEGLSPDEARRRAQLEFGGSEQVKEQCRDVSFASTLESILRDVGYALRGFKRSPLFTLAAVGTLAVGVGLTTGIFSVFNGIFMRELPVPGGGELVDLSRTSEALPGLAGFRFSTNEYGILRDRMETLSDIIAFSDPRDTAVGGWEDPYFVSGTTVSCNYFDVLRQPPIRGRGLVDSDCEAGAAPVVVLGHEFWQSEFGGEPSVIGSTLVLSLPLSQEGPMPFTVVGIADPDTYGPNLEISSYYAPKGALPVEGARLAMLSFAAAEGTVAAPVSTDDVPSWRLIGRRGEGVGLAEVRAELEVVSASFESSRSGREAVSADRATPMPVSDRDRLTAGAALMTPFLLILLIVCANVANLLLSRVTEKGREIAMRLSLGAGRRRVIRQLLTESALIGLAGGLLGSFAAFGSFDRLLEFVLSTLPEGEAPNLAIGLDLDVRVLSVMLALSAGTGLLCGLAPAVRVSRSDLYAAMKPDRVGSGGRRGGWLQSILVGVQVTVCMALMAGTGLSLRSLWVTYTADLGFPYQDLRVVSFGPFLVSDDPEDTFRRRLSEEIRRLPSVEDAAYVSQSLLVSGFPQSVGLAEQSPDQRLPADEFRVSPTYFDTVGIPVVRGRSFFESDSQDDARVVIVNESVAERLWPGRDPIGQTLEVSSQGFRFIIAGESTVTPAQTLSLSVVGVSRDARENGFGETPYVIYRPGSGSIPSYLLVRSQAEPSTLTSEIGGAAAGLDPGLEVSVAALEDNLGMWRDQSRFVSILALALGGLALLLAAVGIYAVVAYAVNRQRREIGIRLALGARSFDVLHAVMGRTLRPVGIGIAVGVVAAYVATEVIAFLLVGVSPADPIGIGGAALFVLGTALAASLLPARRGLQVDPIVTLREE